MNLDAERERLRRLASKATKGPWLVNGSFEVMAGETKVAKAMSLGEHEFVAPRRDANAELIAAAHDMLALIDAQASALAEMQGRVEAETIEQCAKMCDALESDFIKKDAELGDEDDARWVYMATGVRASIRAIRALGKGT